MFKITSKWYLIILWNIPVNKKKIFVSSASFFNDILIFYDLFNYDVNILLV